MLEIEKKQVKQNTFDIHFRQSANKIKTRECERNERPYYIMNIKKNVKVG